MRVVQLFNWEPDFLSLLKNYFAFFFLDRIGRLRRRICTKICFTILFGTVHDVTEVKCTNIGA